MKPNLNIKLNKKIFDYSLVVAALLLAASINSFGQTTIYVSSSAVGSNNGSSWANAYTSFQSALGAASSGDEIWVAKGTYNPSSAYDLTNTSRFYHFRMINGVGIYGGFAGTESAVTERTDYGVGEANETILSGDIGTIDDNSDNCYHVFYHPSGVVDATAILDGFTITRGNADGSDPHNDGGGMYNSSSSPTINNSTFTSNSVNDNGGGMYNISSSPAVTNSLFILNTAVFGGGMSMFNSSVSFNNTTFTLNNASSRGGGIRKTGGAGSPNFNNCIIWGNTATIDGNQISSNGTSAVTLNYSCYANGTGDASGTITATNNNITSDPEFVDADNGDYRIIGNSPAADTGNDIYNSQTYDIRGNGFDRKLDKTDGSAGTIDMGAYEYLFNSDPLPVELTSFNAKVINNSIHLQWQTATEVNNYGFEIERRTEEENGRRGEWENIGFVNGHGNSNSPKFYSFIDNYPFSGTNSYRLKQIDFDGAFEYSETVGISLMKFLQFELDQNYPNPFNPTTKISFTLPNIVDATRPGGQDFASTILLQVYDVLGNEVATLVNELKPVGQYEIKFDASNLTSGIYYYTLSTDTFRETKKMLLIK